MIPGRDEVNVEVVVIVLFEVGRLESLARAAALARTWVTRAAQGRETAEEVVQLARRLLCRLVFGCIRACSAHRQHEQWRRKGIAS